MSQGNSCSELTVTLVLLFWGGIIPGNYEARNGPSYGIGLKAGYAISSWGVVQGICEMRCGCMMI
jgi:hypothetical protein